MGNMCCNEEKTYVFDIVEEKNWEMKPVKIRFNKKFNNSSLDALNNTENESAIMNFSNIHDKPKIMKSRKGVYSRFRQLRNLASSSRYIENENTYYLNQKPEEINRVDLKENGTSEIVYDSAFPQEFVSISNLEEYTPLSDMDRKIMENLTWQRPEYLFKTDNYAFYDRIDIDDVYQGSLENCYFLSSISAMASFPKRIERTLLNNDITETGVYSIKYYIDGVPKIVSVNDYFPCSRKSWIFSYNRTNEIWCQVMEKSWAKLHGSYYNSMLGLPSDCLEAICEAPSEYLVHKKFVPEKLFSFLNFCHKKNFTMVANSSQDEEVMKQGIINSHAYTILGVYEIKVDEQQDKVLKLIKIRNPWGAYEWKGKYNDHDARWTPELRMKLNVKTKDDGIFYMEYDDFYKFFDYTFISLVHDNYIYSYKKGRQDEKDSLLVTSFHVTKEDLELASKTPGNTYVYFSLIGKSKRFYYRKHELNYYLQKGRDARKYLNSLNINFDAGMIESTKTDKNIEDDYNVIVNHPEVLIEDYQFKETLNISEKMSNLGFNSNGKNQSLSLFIAKFNPDTKQYSYFYSISVPEQRVHIHVPIGNFTEGEYHIFYSGLVELPDPEIYNEELHDLVVAAYSPFEIKFNQVPYFIIPDDYLKKILTDMTLKFGMNLCNFSSRHKTTKLKSMHDSNKYSTCINFNFDKSNSYSLIKNFKIGRDKDELFNDFSFQLKNNKDMIKQYSADKLEVFCSSFVENIYFSDYICFLFTNSSKNIIANLSMDVFYDKGYLKCLNNPNYYVETTSNRRKERKGSKENENEKETEIKESKPTTQILASNNSAESIKNEKNLDGKDESYCINLDSNTNINSNNIKYTENKTIKNRKEENEEEEMKCTVSCNVLPNTQELIVFQYKKINKNCHLSIENLDFKFQNLSKLELYRILIQEKINTEEKEEINEDCCFLEIEHYDGIFIVFQNNSEENTYRFRISLEELENLKVVVPKHSPYILTVHPKKWEFIAMEKIKHDFDIDYELDYVYKLME